MTPKEHARVWRKAADELKYSTGAAFVAVWSLADAVATAYEEAAKEEQEGRE